MIGFSYLRLVLLVAAMLSLAGCAAITAVSSASQPLDVYELRAPQSITPSPRGPAAKDVIVELPTTGGALATDRIMIRPDALQAQYLPGVRWSEPVPVMVQTLMLRSLEATGRARYAGREPLGVGGDLALVTEVIDFQAEVDPGGNTATVQIKLLVRMVRERDARIVSSRTFTATAAAPSTENDTVVRAFSAASDIVFSDFANWIAGRV